MSQLDRETFFEHQTASSRVRLIHRRETHVVITIVFISLLMFAVHSVALGWTERQAIATEKADVSELYFPSFRLPWDKSENGQIKWSSGPHSWSKGGALTARISASRGNGLDFAKGGSSFDVVSMADGYVDENRCGYAGLGCIVAIKHSIGGTMMIYAHLEPNSAGNAPLNNLQKGEWYSSGTQIGRAGRSGGQAQVHLHIELRDGTGSCNAPANGVDGNDCGDVSFAGNPIGWDGRQFVDGYYINGYFDIENGCGPGGDCSYIFNYDGSAVNGPISAPYLNFPYKDNGQQRYVEAFVHPSFIDDNVCTSNTNCEINTENTLFADQGLFSGGGGALSSSNSIVYPPDLATPTPTPTSNPGINDNTPPSANGFSASTSGGIANLTTSGVQDNSGGSGVREVRFSAKYNGGWWGIGTASNAPYSLSWDMCASGVPDGDVELGMEVWDNANNKWVWSEHFNNPHITKSYNCTPPPPQEGVFLYKNTGYGGEYLCPIFDDVPSLRNYCGDDWNDEVESVRVEGSYYFALYRDDNYGGGQPYSGNPSGDLPGEWRNQTSSVRVRRSSPAAFTLYDLGDYNGVPWSSDRTVWDMNHWNWNDRAQSIRVASGYGFVVCEHSDFKGTCARADGPNQWSDINALGQGLRDNVSSIRVCPGSCPEAGSTPTLNYPIGNQILSPGQSVVLNWSGPLNQFNIELWGGGIEGTRQRGWTSDSQWDVGVLPESSNPYYWHVKGWRGYGETAWGTESFYVTSPDTTAPTGKITAPGQGGYRGGPTVKIEADASDSGSGVKQLGFYAWIDDKWSFLGTDSAAPYEYTWDISSVREGGVWVTADVIDNAGNHSGLIWEPDWRFFIIDRTAPDSHVIPLPAIQQKTSFTVRWSGNDNFTPNDLIFYDVQYQLDCQGDWLDWFVMDDMEGSLFNGEEGKSYCFRSRAYDLVGNTENWPDSADAQTTVARIRSLYLPVVVDNAIAPTPTPTASPTPTRTPTPTPKLLRPIVYISAEDGNNEIYVAKPDGSDPKRLTTNVANDQGPSWSGDGMHIAFQSDRIGYSQIYVMDGDGSNQIRLFTSTTIDEWPQYAPDNSRIAFARVGDFGNGRRTEVFVMSSDGTNVQQLTHTSGSTSGFSHGCWPSGWSPDSTQILYYCYQDGIDQIKIMAADGSNQRRIVTGTHWDAIPTMSPDGTKIAFASFRDGNYEIYTVGSDGSGLKRLTSSVAEDWRPSWSADSTKIIFESKRAGPTGEYIMNSDGSNQQPLIVRNVYVGQGIWAPTR